MTASALAGPIPPRSLRVNGVHVNAIRDHKAAEHLLWTIETHRRAVERIPGAALDEQHCIAGGVYTLTWPPEFADLPSLTYARLLERGVPRTAMRLSPDVRRKEVAGDGR